MDNITKGFDGGSTGLREVRGALAPEPSLMERVTCGERVWRGKVFAVDHLEVELADGSRAWREVARHHGGAGAVAIREGRVCLVRQYRVALGRITLEIPAGRLEAGERGEDCAARELAEETGLRAERLVRLATVLGSPGFTDEHTEIYLAQGLSQGVAMPDEGEAVRVAWLPVGEVVHAISAGLIQDGKTVTGVLAARERLGDGKMGDLR
ncbi:MAG: NUDIX hydrolase [Coriobacteriaceae bacterium]|nr:NUDIX hydrolase [Coriobacteriaceae bacterium]MCI6844794.1 NUDIX hydrolase [Coriobacteriaceae bacterium]MDD7583911.1 NUDIX hydrolase [Coriobacteriaceae bacterium]